MTPSNCRTCDARIYWMITRNRKNMPVDISSVKEFDMIAGKPLFDPERYGHVSHFSTCPNAGEHRRARG